MPSVLLLAGLVAMLAGAEAAARAVLSPSSRIQQRVTNELDGARSLRAGSGSREKSVLIAGNSLLLAGVEMDRLRSALQPDWRCQRLVIESTTYLDWLYGLRRLHREGARPNVVVLMLSTRHFLESAVRQDYFAHYLMGIEDLPAVAMATEMHPTVATGMSLAHYSLFYGIRSELRRTLLGNLFPGLERLTGLLTRRKRMALDLEKVKPVAEERARELEQLSRSDGYRLVVVLPPAGDEDLQQPEVADLLRRQGLTVLVPVSSQDVPKTQYSDGFHLNNEGARVFTDRLAHELKGAL